MTEPIPNRPPENAAEDKLLRSERRDWQFWSVLVLGLFMLGLGFAIYSLLVSQPSAWTAHGVAQLVPPLLFGVIALLVLVNFYVAQKDSVIRGLESELVHQKIEAELNRELALLDPVTEVYNRRYLRVLLAKEISRVNRYGKGLAVMMVDILGFRKVNESLGHTGGDVVLRQIAQLLQERLRNSDMIIRYGGDEFLLILTHVERENIELTLGRLREQFGAQIFAFNGQKVKVTASFGITGFEGKVAPEIGALVRQADEALYTAKRGGGNQVKVESC